MASVRKTTSPRGRGRPPATSIEAREQQLVSQAVDLAERQIQDGTASAQVLSHYLKLGSTREKLEQDRLRSENEMLRAKVSQIESGKNVEELYANAIDAMRTYTGNGDDSYDD